MVEDIQAWNKKVQVLRDYILLLESNLTQCTQNKLLSPEVASYATSQLREAKDALARIK
jgi:hypothetical protein